MRRQLVCGAVALLPSAQWAGGKIGRFVCSGVLNSSSSDVLSIPTRKDGVPTLRISGFHFLRLSHLLKTSPRPTVLTHASSFTYLHDFWGGKLRGVTREQTCGFS